jgi:hypothetical protein
MLFHPREGLRKTAGKNGGRPICSIEMEFLGNGVGKIARRGCTGRGIYPTFAGTAGDHLLVLIVFVLAESLRSTNLYVSSRMFYAFPYQQQNDGSGWASFA